MKWKWDTDRIVSLSAMVVGVGSLVIILYQTKLMREQQRASVMPYLMMAIQSSTNDHRTYLTVRNAASVRHCSATCGFATRARISQAIPTTFSSSSVPRS